MLLDPQPPRDDDQSPGFVCHRHTRTDTHILTSGDWHSFSPFGNLYVPCAETGVRCLKTGDFMLIEHGCSRWDLVERVIIHGLRRGWSGVVIEGVIRRVDRRTATA